MLKSMFGILNYEVLFRYTIFINIITWPESYLSIQIVTYFLIINYLLIYLLIYLLNLFKIVICLRPTFIIPQNVQ